jgi:hypothetical protein
MNTAQTVTTAGLLKPDRASVGLTKPVIATMPKTSNATTSIGIHSVTKNIMATARMKRARAICGVTAC